MQVGEFAKPAATEEGRKQQRADLEEALKQEWYQEYLAELDEAVAKEATKAAEDASKAEAQEAQSPDAGAGESSSGRRSRFRRLLRVERK